MMIKIKRKIVGILKILILKLKVEANSEVKVKKNQKLIMKDIKRLQKSFLKKVLKHKKISKKKIMMIKNKII